MKEKSVVIKSKTLVKRGVLSVFGFFISVTLFSQAPTDGLILHYTFDKIDGTSIPDSSGNSNAGTLQGAAASVAGYIKQGVQCPTRDDYVRLPANFTTSLTSFSFMTWVKLNSLKNATRFFDLGTGAEGTNNFLAFIPSYNADNNYITLRYRPSSGTAYNVTSSVKCPVGSWAHIALTFDWNSGTSTSTVTIYINGTAVGLSTGNTMPINPGSALGNTADNYMGHSRWTNDNNGFDGIFDEVCFYNRVLTATEIENTAYPTELNTQWHALSLGDLSKVKTNLSLPATQGGASITWESSKPSIIATDGTVTRPVQFDATVTLTATLSYNDGGVVTTRKKDFVATVTATNPTEELLARWNFAKNKISESAGEVQVTDATPSGFVGTLKDVASIRTIGKTNQFNVLDLGNNKGHFDMGTPIGEVIYNLTDYTMSAYFRVDTAYKQLTSAGNFLWTFSNAEDQEATRNGYLIGRVNVMGQSVSTNYFSSGNQAVTVGSPASQGTWHHMAYTQQGDSGKVFVDGVLKVKGKITNIPSTIFANNELTGTPYNWIGRSCYESRGDVYLRQTLVYDFRLYRIAVSQDDFTTMNIPGTLDSLNRAYAERPYDTLPELKTEMQNLTLGDISAVNSNLVLPATGTLDPSIKISWISAVPALISNEGVITQYDYINHRVTLTAVLSKGGQKVTKDFEVNVLANSGTGFASDLILSYDFADDKVSGTTVTDAAEKHYAGALMKNASVISIGTAENKHKVLSLDADSAYFDMGADCGKLIYGLADYSVSVYFLVHNNKSNLSADGNFIYTFSNSDSAGTAQNGYIFGRASYATHSVSSSYWNSGNISTAGTLAVTSQGIFHHLVFTQHGTTGTAYLDGKAISTVTSFTNLPFSAVAKPEFTGTRFNWLGRSNYVSDAYLANTWLADFQLYKKALSAEEVAAMQTKRTSLNLAYIQDSVPTLLAERDALSLDNLDQLVSEIILPSNGTLDPNITISWSSSYPGLISTSGFVNRPDYLDTKVVLTATLTKDGQILTREFIATVIANPPQYTSDLILNYNFASSTGTTVIDAAEKHFSGNLMKGATVKTIGPVGNKHNVLDLPSDSAYFDMGIDCGKLIYSLNDYTTSVYFFIDTAKTNFFADGNIIYCFSNSDSSNINSDVKKNGYLFGRATNVVHGVTSASSKSGLIKTAASTNTPTEGVFHHMAFTQNGLEGTTYIDGEMVSSVASFTNLPSLALTQTGNTGTLYNWLGRSSNLGEAYLGKAMIAEFKLYKKALTSSQIDSMQFTTRSLNAAYNGKVSVAQAKFSDKGLRVDNSTPGVIRILGLPGNVRIKVYDLVGRRVVETDRHEISLHSGIYIIRAGNDAAKVFVY